MNYTLSNADIIGDVHGEAEKLVQLLALLGYRELNGIFQHPSRTLVSLGDLIDRGPYQRDVINILMPMQQAGFANIIAANHEFNAVSWATKGSNGQYLRPHSDKNRIQHQEFLNQAGFNSPWYTKTIDWFKTLPLLAEFEKFQCIHACWDKEQVALLKNNLTPELTLRPEQWEQANDKSHPLYHAIEHCIKGPEILLPESQAYEDPNGIMRRTKRVEWWKSPSNIHKPTFFGHYWMSGTPKLIQKDLACLDWSVAKNGVLAAYRYSGENELSNHNLVWV